MPCGGIFPTKGDCAVGLLRCGETGFCMVCNGSGAYHFVEEWDGFIHARCVGEFLGTTEGKIILRHQHQIILDPEQEERIVIPELEGPEADY